SRRTAACGWKPLPAAARTASASTGPSTSPTRASASVSALPCRATWTRPCSTRHLPASARNWRASWLPTARAVATSSTSATASTSTLIRITPRPSSTRCTNFPRPGTSKDVDAGNPAAYAWVALGANLPRGAADPAATLRAVLPELQALATGPLLVSAFYESDPRDCPPGSPRYVNAVA